MQRCEPRESHSGRTRESCRAVARDETGMIAWNQLEKVQRIMEVISVGTTLFIWMVKTSMPTQWGID